MSIIYDFNALTVEELQQFAEGLVQKLNSTHVFTSDIDFKLDSTIADEITGNLLIGVTHDNDYLEVTREARWTCASEDEVEEDPGYDADFTNLLFEDTIKAFKTLSTEIDEYKVTLAVEDVTEEETAEVAAGSYSQEDAGIGDFEYWGHVEHDSRPYFEVEGTIIKNCSCYLTLTVEPIE